MIGERESHFVNIYPQFVNTEIEMILDQGKVLAEGAAKTEGPGRGGKLAKFYYIADDDLGVRSPSASLNAAENDLSDASVGWRSGATGRMV